MSANPEIEIYGDRIVHFDHCQIGHISREGTMRRFWFWPEFDMRAARPVTGDLSACLKDGDSLRKAIRVALSMAVRAPRRALSARKFPGAPFGLPRWPFHSYVERLARKRDQRLFARSLRAA